MYLYEDKTTRGVGGVYIHDEAEKRTMKGDDIMYNPETGFGKIQGMVTWNLLMVLSRRL